MAFDKRLQQLPSENNEPKKCPRCGRLVRESRGVVGDSALPVLSMGPDGVPVVAWSDETSGDFEIYVRRLDGTEWQGSP